jgi:hypothetical protein
MSLVQVMHHVTRNSYVQYALAASTVLAFTFFFMPLSSSLLPGTYIHPMHASPCYMSLDVSPLVIAMDGMACLQFTLYYGIAIGAIVFGTVATQSREVEQVQSVIGYSYRSSLTTIHIDSPSNIIE